MFHRKRSYLEIIWKYYCKYLRIANSVYNLCKIYILNLFLVDGKTLNNQSESGLPSFKWIDPFGEYERLEITFPDRGSKDVAVLKNSSHCIFKGHLIDEKGVFVALNGCPGSTTFDVRHET